MAGLGQRLARQWESPPTWLVATAAVIWTQAQVLPLLPAGLLLRGAGLVLILAGLAVMATAIAAFARQRTTVLPREVPQRLLTTGLYGLSRNPIYLADAMILAGLALRLDAATLPWVAVFAAVIERRFIRGEEAVCAATFGPAWQTYAARVRRWL
jgi:protein-S-isoprenylcysteine O-methyltransferase Ste14